MRKKLNIILGNAAVNNGNRGCVALSYTSIYLIDKVLSDAGIDYNLYLTDSGQRESGKHYIEISGRKVPYICIMHAVPWNLREKGRSLFRHKEYLKSLKTYRHSDFILDIGQGDSFADIYGKERFDWINLIHREAVLFHKPYCILPQTIGPFKNDAIRAKAAKAISKADLVMARDGQSYHYTMELAPQQKKLNEYIDVAFFLPYKKQEFNKGFIHVGLNISALLWHGGYTRANQFGLADDYQSIVREIIRYFLKQPNVRLHLIPHVVGSERHIENDYAISFDLQKEFDNPNLILSPLFLSPVDAKDYISGMDFFMGARMHSTIAAFSSGVPVVPMAYSRKFNGLFIDTLNYNHLVDLKTETGGDSINKIISSFENRDYLREEIRRRNETVVEEKKKMLVNDLKRFFRL